MPSHAWADVMPSHVCQALQAQSMFEALLAKPCMSAAMQQQTQMHIQLQELSNVRSATMSAGQPIAGLVKRLTVSGSFLSKMSHMRSKRERRAAGRLMFSTGLRLTS